MPTLYEITVPVMVSSLKTLSTLVEMGATHVGPEKISTILEAKLIDDMGDFIYQIQRISDNAKGTIVRLGFAETVAWEDNEKTLADVQERLKKTIDFLEAIKPKTVEGEDDVEVVLKTRSQDIKFTAKDYVLKWALPNFYFHFVTAYGLLRKEGVPVGKIDYLGRR